MQNTNNPNSFLLVGTGHQHQMELLPVWPQGTLPTADPVWTVEVQTATLPHKATPTPQKLPLHEESNVC